MVHKETLQIQLLLSGLNHPDIARNIFSQAPKQLFPSEPFLTVSKTISRYYYSNSELLTKDTLKARLEDTLTRLERLRVKSKEESFTDEQLKSYYNLVESLYNTNQDSSESLVKSLNDYVKRNLSEAAIYDEVSKESPDIYKTLGERLDKIKSINLSGNNDDLIDVVKDFKLRLELYKNLNKEKIPLGFDNLDYILKGGLSKQKVMLINAVSGRGKTTMLSNLSANMLVEGYNVLHISLEEIDGEQMLRFDKIITGGSGSDILKGLNGNKEGLKNTYKRYKSFSHLGKLIYIAKKPNTCTVDDLNQIIIEANRRLQDKKIDVVVLDYPELMAGIHETGNEAVDGETLYQDLSRIAQEYNILMITGSQLNRASNGQETQTFASVEGSYRKQNICSFVATINSNDAEREKGYMRLYLDKLRDRERVTDSFVYFKYNRYNLRYSCETDDEKEEHQQLLQEGASDIKDTNRSKHKQDVQNKRDKIMNQFVNVN